MSSAHPSRTSQSITLGDVHDALTYLHILMKKISPFLDKDQVLDRNLLFSKIANQQLENAEMMEALKEVEEFVAQNPGNPVGNALHLAIRSQSSMILGFTDLLVELGNDVKGTPYGSWLNASMLTAAKDPSSGEQLDLSLKEAQGFMRDFKKRMEYMKGNEYSISVIVGNPTTISSELNAKFCMALYRKWNEAKVKGKNDDDVIEEVFGDDEYPNLMQECGLLGNTTKIKCTDGSFNKLGRLTYFEIVYLIMENINFTLFVSNEQKENFEADLSEFLHLVTFRRVEELCWSKEDRAHRERLYQPTIVLKVFQEEFLRLQSLFTFKATSIGV